MAVSLSGMNSDLDSYLFGSIYAISDEDVVISVVLALLVLILFVFFYTRIFAITFDESFARATGTKAGLYNMLIALLTAITIVVGMRMMGSMLISSLIIFPALCSMRVFKSFKGGHGVLGGHLSGDVHCGHGDLIRVRNSRRCEHRLREYPGVCGIHGGWRGHEP